MSPQTKHLPWKLRFQRSFLPGVAIILPLLALGAWLIAGSLMPTAKAVGINRQINYQGKLASSTGVAIPNGSYNFHFSLWDASSGGNMLWEEAWSTASSTSQVSSTWGVFSAALGTYVDLPASVFANDNIFLQVGFDSDGNDDFDQTFSPRKRLTASPYAFNSDTLDGYNASTTATSGTIPVLDGNAGLTVSGVTTTGNIYTSGDLTVLGNTNFATITVTNLITTNNVELGVVTTGTWQGGIIGAAYGGTGQDSTLWSDGFAYVSGGVWQSTTSLSGLEADPVWLAAAPSVITTSAIFGGDVSGTYNAIVVANNSHVHGPTTIQNLTPADFATNTISQWYNDSGYITNASETDPIWGAASGTLSVYHFADQGLLQWGNDAGYITSSSAEDLTNKTGLISMWTNDINYITNASETDPIWGAASSSYLTTTSAEGLYVDVAGDTMTGALTVNNNIVVSSTGHIDVSSSSLGYWLGGTKILFIPNDNNLAVGVQTLISNTTGLDNTAVGNGVMYANSSGGRNTAVGVNSLFSNLSSDANTAIGFGSLYSSLDSANTALGYDAGRSLISGGSNVFLGYQSGLGITTGTKNILIGSGAGVPASTTNSFLNIGDTIYGDLLNDFVGIGVIAPSVALEVAGVVSSTDLQVNGNATVTSLAIDTLDGLLYGTGGVVATISTSSLGLMASGTDYWVNTTGDTMTGALVVEDSYILASGTSYIEVASGTVGYWFDGQKFIHTSNNGNNLAIGVSALAINTIGQDNTVVGTNALAANTTGDGNSAFGFYALNANTGGNYNTAIGFSALTSNINGSENVAIGDGPLSSSQGNNNIAVGTGAGQVLVNGDSNIFLGVMAGSNIATGSNNIIIGNSINAISSTSDNFLNIGDTIYGDLANKYIGINLNYLPTTALEVNGTVSSTDLVISNNATVASLTIGTLAGLLYATGGVVGTTSISALETDPIWAAASGTLSVSHFADQGLLQWSNDAGYITSSSAEDLTNKTGLISMWTNDINYITNASETDPIWSAASSSYLTTTSAEGLYVDVAGDTMTGALVVEDSYILASGTSYIEVASGTVGYWFDGQKFIHTSNNGNNLAIGVSALAINTIGQDNTVVGTNALAANTTGDGNSAFGFYALNANTGGNYNTAIGFSALTSNINGLSNVAIGDGALSSSQGNNNTAIGAGAGGLLASGNGNVFLGMQVGDNIATGSNNIIIGNSIDAISSTSDNFLNIGDTIYGDLANKYIGINLNYLPTTALEVNGTVSSTDLVISNNATVTSLTIGTLDGLLYGTGGVVGITSSLAALETDPIWGAASSSYLTTTSADGLYVSIAGDTMTGNLNVNNSYINVASSGLGYWLGGQKFIYAPAGANNIAIGNNVLSSNSGDYNTAVGSYALSDNANGTQNTALGTYALYSNTTGNDNVAVGFNPLVANITGSNNTALGSDAGSTLVSGSNNTFLGYSTGINLTTGTNNILIGYNANALSASSSNFLNIGNTIYGDLSVGKVGIGTVSPNTELEVAGTVSSTGLQVNGNATTTGNLYVLSTSTMRDIIPETNLTYNLGSNAYRWDNVWAGTLNVGTSTWSINNGDDGRLSIYDAAQGGGNERLSILTNGNVGIGVTTPQAGLHITGSGLLVDGPTNPSLVSSTGQIDGGFSDRLYISGKYAYVASLIGGLAILDISNPSNPTIVSSTGYLLGEYVSDVYVSGKYAYLANGGQGLTIMDVSNPSNPVLVSSTGVISGGDISNLYISGKYAYLTNGNGGLTIIDISNSSNPTLVSSTGDITSGTALGVYVSGKYAYVANGFQGLAIVDISNPYSPVLTSSTGPIASGYANDVYVSGKYAYLANGGQCLAIVDISNPYSPVLASSTGPVVPSNHAENVHVSGKYAYVANGIGGLSIFNISEPDSPILVTSTGQIVGNNVSGVYISGKYAYLAIGNGGLAIMDLKGADILLANIGNINTNALTVSENIDVSGILNVGTSLHVGAGGILSEGPVAINNDAYFSGNVGIGTAAPTYKLTVDVSSNTYDGISVINTDSGIYAQARFNATTSAGDITMSAYGSSFYKSAVAGRGAVFTEATSSLGLTLGSINPTGDIQFLTGGDTVNDIRMTIASSGNVGIGTTNPLAPFVVRSDSDIGIPANAALYNASTGTNNGAGLSLRTDTYGAGAQTFMEVAGINSITTDHNHATRNTDLRFFTDNYSDVGATDKMTLTGTGNLGIGTTTPATKLVVMGTSTMRNIIPDMTLGVGNVSQYSLGASTTRWNNVWTNNIYVGSSTWQFSQGGDGHLSIGNIGGSERLAISTGGVVSIAGTISTTNLVVNGQVFSSSIDGLEVAGSLITGQGTNQISTSSENAAVIGGGLNSIIDSSYYAGIFGGAGNGITSTAMSVILGGSANGIITKSDRSAVLGGMSNFITGTSTLSAIIAGQSNKIMNEVGNSVILGGINNSISGLVYHSIVGGNSGAMLAHNSFLYTASAVTSSQNYTASFYGVDVGIGTTTPISMLHVVDPAAGGSTNVFVITTSSNIFRVTADGNAYADGSFTGGGADYAEYFYSRDTDLTAGEAVCVDVSKNNAVVRCTRAGDDNIMGIVSTKPAIVGNAKEGYENNPSYKIVAMLGQIPAKASAENGEIRPGDYLTAASIPGYVMKAGTGDATVGVALEGLSFREGTINVMISRRNKSMTVEQVEDAVTARIADMELEDEVNIMLADTIRSYDFTDDIAAYLNPYIASIDAKLSLLTDTLGLKVGELAATTLGADEALSSQIMAAGDLISLLNQEVSTTIDNLSVTNAKVEGLDALVLDHSDRLSALELFTSSSIADLQSAVASLSVTTSSPLQVEDDLLTVSTLVVMQSADFVGTITVRGEANFEAKVTFGAEAEFKDHITLDKDSAGTVVIAAGTSTVEVVFAKPYQSEPKVLANLNNSEKYLFAIYKIADKTKEGFKIVLSDPATQDLNFDWLAFAVNQEEADTEDLPPVEPIVEEPVIEEPVISEEEPVIEEPIVIEELPVVEEPVIEEPMEEVPAPSADPVTEPAVETEPVAAAEPVELPPTLLPE